MRVVQDNLRFCADCACWAANGDDSGIESEARRKHVHKCVAAFGPHLVSGTTPPDAYDEGDCDSCDSYLGYYSVFAVLGPDEWSASPVPNARHDGVYLNRDGKRLVRVQSVGRAKHTATLVPALVRLLNALEPASRHLALIEAALDHHEAYSAEDGSCEHKAYQALQDLKRIVGGTP